MIIFTTSLYSEAKPLIQRLNLKKNTNEHLFQLFEGEHYHIVITGCGMIPSALSLSRYFTLYPPKDNDIFINLGIAGYLANNDEPPSIGSLFLISKITEQCTNRTFYPDILYENTLDKLPLLTVPIPLKDNSSCSETNTLVDMEGSVLYQATLPFIFPERMFFFKIISDIIGTTNLKEQPILPEQLIVPHLQTILNFATKIETIQKERFHTKNIVFKEKEQELMEEIFSRLCLTETMAGDFRRFTTYAKLDQKPLEQILTNFLTELPVTPIRGKKQTMPYLTILREKILSTPSIPKKENTQKIVSTTTAYLPFFSTVYAEKQVQEKLHSFSLPCEPIFIEHYKDLFNRSHQNFAEQKKAPSLILAKKTGTLIYKGAPVCQSFGNEYFYYTSCMMNCIYHCDYCYLQGMYPSGHVVVFINLEDYFKELELLLKKHPVYLCISYDTDLLALESRFGFVKRWLSFAKTHKNLSLEIRTKSGNPMIFQELAKLFEQPSSPLEEIQSLTQQKQQIIFAWTISPETIIETIEHGTASLSLRLKALLAAKEAGFSVRLCFDPMIYHSNWKESYAQLVLEIFSKIPSEVLFDVSIGVFRISTEYLKNMRKKRPDCAIVQYPYITEQGVSHYGTLSEEMVNYLYELLLSYLPTEKIFIWNGGI